MRPNRLLALACHDGGGWRVQVGGWRVEGGRVEGGKCRCMREEDMQDDACEGVEG
jgi:hypothetical protein